MARQEEFEGKDLQEALNLAASAMGMAEPDLDYEIVEQGRPGLFGLGMKNVRIRIIPPVDGTLEPVARPAPPQAPAERKPRTRSKPRSKPRPAPPAQARQQPDPSPEAEKALATLQRMLDLMGLDVQARLKSVNKGMGVQLDGTDRKLLAQKDGELVSALQFLLNRMSRRAWPGVGRIHLQFDGKREVRDEDLVAMAREAARHVVRSGRSKRLRPMNAYERRLVHMTAREIEGVGSRSEGDGYLKRVRIFKQKSRGGN